MFKKNWPILLLALFLLFFLIFFPRHTGKELIWSQESWENLQLNPSSDSLVHEDYWFRSKDYVFSYSEEGQVVRTFSLDENLSIGESVILNNNGENIQLLSLNGDGDLEIPIIEDPVLQGDDLFSIDPYRQLTLWSSQGESLYSIEFPMLLTAYDFREDYFFGGFINGEVSLYKEDRLIQNIRPGGSRIQAIYGLAIGGADASLFGLISGLDPQRILIYEKKSQEYRPVFHDNLEGEFRRPVIMGYSQRGNYFYYEEKDGLSFIYLKDLTKESMPLSGRLVDVYFPPEVDNPLILSKGDNRYYLSSYLHGKRIFYRQLSGEFLRLYPLEDSMLLVLDNQILNMKWSMQ